MFLIVGNLFREKLCLGFWSMEINRVRLKLNGYFVIERNFGDV